jgi:hypothetical protein
MDTKTTTLLCPFALTVEPMAAMLNFEIADDPTYAGLEIQRFDDPVHGSGLAVLLMRREDRRVDVYHEPGLRLDRASYGIGAGLGGWHEAEIEPARLEVTSHGAVVDIGLLDAAGRRIEVRADDRAGRPRTTGALLAPVSAAIERPTSMLLVWMPRFDLLRAIGRPPEIRIDGRPARTGQLPATRLHRRHLIKMAADLAIVRLNPAQDGPLTPVDPDAAPGVVIDRTGPRPTIAGVTVVAGGHEASLVLDPPLADLTRLGERATVAGTWHLAVDQEPSLVSGSWSASRSADRVELALDSTAPWRPGRLPLLMRIVTRVVPTFRSWPRTYRWRGVIDLGAGPTATPTMTSRWERTAATRDESYGRMMRVPR